MRCAYHPCEDALLLVHEYMGKGWKLQDVSGSIACATWIVTVASKDERGRAIGVHETLMGLAIAVGPLLLVVFGVESAAPYYACTVIVLSFGALALTLKGYDTRLRTPAENAMASCSAPFQRYCVVRLSQAFWKPHSYLS